MRISALSGKEIVHIQRAERLGILGDTDVEFDPKTGKVLSIVIPLQRWSPFSKGQQEHHISWNSIKTIGEDIILIDQQESGEQVRHSIHTIGQNEDQ